LIGALAALKAAKSVLDSSKESAVLGKKQS